MTDDPATDRNLSHVTTRELVAYRTMAKRRRVRNRTDADALIAAIDAELDRRRALWFARRTPPHTGSVS